MITKVTITNFKKLENISFNLSQSVVVIGPNNSGKSTIFQALCLWEIGVKNYLQSSQKHDLNKNGAATINRRDLLNSPIADGGFLWRNRIVTHRNEQGYTKHVKLLVELEGDNDGNKWSCLAEFEFSNAESFSCKVLKGAKELSQLYNTGKGIHFGFLQPMSGISTNEDKLTQGSIDRKLGEGKTAEVLRNICYEILYPDTPHPEGYNTEEKWTKLCLGIKSMFGADLSRPEFIKATGLIQLEYTETRIKYDISSAGRGFQQTLLLLAYMYANPNTILLLDEPDAHLEVIRQREAFHLINEVANDMNSQILIASHSEVVLDEAVEASRIIALIENKIFELNHAPTPQKVRYIKKALTEIGWEKYYLARVRKHVLYLEGPSDLQMLLQLANKLKHMIEPILRVANVQYTSDNVPASAINNFTSLQEIFPELNGIALFDNIPNLQSNPKLKIVCWQRRELENYFARPEILILYANLLGYRFPAKGPVRFTDIMRKTINDLTVPLYLQDLNNEWWSKAKLSDDWMDVIFKEFYKRVGLPQDFYKRDYYQLIKLMKPEEIDSEIIEKLDAIYEVIKQ